MSDLVWGPVQWETLSGGSTGWDPLWTARSCHAFHPGWLGPNRLPGNWGTKKKKERKMDTEIKEWWHWTPWRANPKRQHINGNYTVICIITPLVIVVRVSAINQNTAESTFACYFFFTYSLMAILSECRDDTDDMLWDICKEKDHSDASRYQRRQCWLMTSIICLSLEFRRNELNERNAALLLRSVIFLIRCQFYSLCINH